MNFQKLGKKLAAKLSIVLLFSAALPVQANDDFKINSFLSVAGSSISEEGRYLDKITEHFSFENDSVYGFNIRSKINDKVSGAAQLLATSNDSSFNVEAEWAYFSYKFSKTSSLRVGKLNLSTFLISDYINIGYFYPWIRTPVEVYENNPIKNYHGAEWLYISHFGQKSKLTTQLFMGSGQVEKDNLLFRGTEGVGFNIQLDMPSVTFRLGVISPMIQLEGVDSGTGQTIDIVDLNDRGYMYTAGLRVNMKSFMLYAESVETDTEGATQAIFPNQRGSYVTLGYRMGKYLPHVTVASADGDIYTGALPAAISAAAKPITQDSITYGLRYNLDKNTALKVEYQQVELDLTAGDGFASLDANKTTPTVDSFDVYTIALDFIF